MYNNFKKYICALCNSLHLKVKLILPIIYHLSEKLLKKSVCSFYLDSLYLFQAWFENEIIYIQLCLNSKVK